MGLVMDFEKLKAMLDDVVSDFDHVDLGTISALRRNNSSAENVAKYIYERLLVKLPDSVQLRSVRVVEEPGCSAEFSR
jgi:6-pyruvoyl-tetrahydropterin synthase